MAGIARFAGWELYAYVEWLAALSLAGAHVVGEWLLGDRSSRGFITTGDSREALRQRWPHWLIDVRWMLAIAAVPWSWHLIPDVRLAQLVAGGAAFLWLVRPGPAPIPVQSCRGERRER
jgi:hypothetical protein